MCHESRPVLPNCISNKILGEIIFSIFPKYLLDCSLKWIYKFSIPVLFLTVSLFAGLQQLMKLKSPKVHLFWQVLTCPPHNLLFWIWSLHSGRSVCCYGNSWPGVPRLTLMWTPSTSQSSSCKAGDFCSQSSARTHCKRTHMTHTWFFIMAGVRHSEGGVCQQECKTESHC